MDPRHCQLLHCSHEQGRGGVCGVVPSVKDPLKQVRGAGRLQLLEVLCVTDMALDKEKVGRGSFSSLDEG